MTATLATCYGFTRDLLDTDRYSTRKPPQTFSLGIMKTILRNILAVIVGIVAGSLLNMALVALGPMLIPPPPGVNMSDAASLSSSIHLLEPRHFVFPFLAHAVGTFAGAAVAFLLAANRRWAMAWTVGAVFLAGGIAASMMIAAPLWFVILDLLFGYLPPAWLGGHFASRFVRASAPPA